MGNPVRSAADHRPRMKIFSFFYFIIMRNTLFTIGLSVTLLTAIAAPAFANITPYTDVPSGAYYEDAAAALLLNGALDSSETLFRPNSLATRAEMMKLLVNVYGTTLVNPSTPSFSDIPRSAWYYTYIETAAREGWLRGDNNCYGTSVLNCTARPASNVNRAEMATIVERAFRLTHLNTAPIFSDNTNTRTWYHIPVQVAADHCVLQGDDATGLVRPAAFMNRAEMIVMAHRAQQQQRYGQDCGVPAGQLLNITTPTSRSVYVTFNTDLDPSRIDEISRYSMEESNGSVIDIADIYVINSRTIQLSMTDSLMNGATYRLRITSMRTENGALFSDTRTFVSTSGEDENATIGNAVALSSTKVRLTFNADLNESRAEDKSRYTLTRINTSETVSVQAATLVSARIVDIDLGANLATNSSYSIAVSNLTTDVGNVFSDSAIFINSTTYPSGHIQSVSASNSTKIRISFDSDLDEVRAEQTIRYSVSTNNESLNISSANLLADERTVELTLSQALTSQTPYTVNVVNLLTLDNVNFSDSEVFVFSSTSSLFKASLYGNKEIPLVHTSMSGTGSFTLTSTGLQYAVTVRNLSGSIIGAHFHLGNAGSNGPVVQAISFSNNTSTGTWDLTNDQRTSLLAGDIYVNIHTAAHPDGEIRGQLMPE